MFDRNSHFDPGKVSKGQALSVTRKRCWEYDWELEYDIRGLFDNIDTWLDAVLRIL